MKGFMEFVRKQGIVGLAIGFIVGLATAAVVSSLHLGKATFSYGAFIAALINFIVILAVIYLVFKVTRLEDGRLQGER